MSPARGRRAGDKDIPPSLSARFLLTALTKRGSGVTRGSPGRTDRAEETTARSTEENERDEDGRKPRGCASRGAATAGRADADSTRRRRLRFARSYPGSSGGHVSRSTTVSRSRARDTEGRRPERAARDVPSVSASRCLTGRFHRCASVESRAASRGEVIGRTDQTASFRLRVTILRFPPTTHVFFVPVRDDSRAPFARCAQNARDATRSRRERPRLTRAQALGASR